jgi:hypothetical protein
MSGSNGELQIMRTSVKQSRKLCLVLIIFCLRRLQQSTGAGPAVVKPETVGLSSERLERIGKTVQKDIDDKRIAGAIALVIRHGLPHKPPLPLKSRRRTLPKKNLRNSS